MRPHILNNTLSNTDKHSNSYHALLFIYQQFLAYSYRAVATSLFYTYEQIRAHFMSKDDYDTFSHLDCILQ